MKRVILVMVIAFAVATVVSAQSYTVHEVRGRVEKEVDGRRVLITEGEVLSGDLIVHTRIGTSLILNGSEGTITIPAAKSGKLSDLVAAAPANNVRVTGNVNRVDTGVANRTTGQASTASARANDQGE